MQISFAVHNAYIRTNPFPEILSSFRKFKDKLDNSALKTCDINLQRLRDVYQKCCGKIWNLSGEQKLKPNHLKK